MNTKFHVVRVTTRGYQLLESFDNQQAALRRVVADPLRIGGCVMRDGNTGKRYCPAECREMLQ